MAERNRNFRTGDRVDAPGEYICEAGQKRGYKEGEEFAHCPETGRETTWRREGEDRLI